MIVLRLFGSQRQPFTALAVSLFLAFLTGVVEETTFRGLNLAAAGEWATANLGFQDGTAFGALVSTLVFAALHVNLPSLLEGGEAAADGLALLGLQLCTGATFAALYLSTGNLLVPIVAHTAYDLYTLYATHLVVAGQMEYAGSARSARSASSSMVKQLTATRGKEFAEGALETFFLMDTNQDGVISRKELRIGLASYGLRLSQLDCEKIMAASDDDESGYIEESEFLKLLESSGSVEEAAKQALLGVR